MFQFELLYPELQKFDGLPQALQSEFSLPLSTFEIKGTNFSEFQRFPEFEDNNIYHLPTKVISKEGRWVDVDVALERRLFILTLGENKDIASAFLETTSLQNSFSAIHAWLVGRISVAKLKNIDSTAHVLDLSDDIQHIRWQWIKRHRQAVNAGIFTWLLAPFFASAIQDPVLNQLTPYTSHDALFLSRYIEFPFSSTGLPLCAPLLDISTYHSYKRIIRDRKTNEAKELLRKIPPRFELELDKNQHEYKLSDIHHQLIGKGDEITILGLILESTCKMFEVISNGNKIGVGNVELAKKLMREAIPENTGRAIRHSNQET